MTTSFNKLGSPTRQGSWGLTVDNHAHPSHVVVLRYPDENRRNPAPPTEVVSLPFQGLTLEFAEVLSHSTAMPDGTARALTSRLASKLASHRVSYL